MRSLFIKFQLFCLLQCIMIAGNAQSITGNITDATTREILPGVNITIADHGGVSSDENGNYNLQLPPGKYVLNFSFLGYETKQITVVLGKDDIRQLPVILEPASQLLDPIVVSGSLFEKKQSEETISMVIADQRLLEHTNTTNLSDAITKVPGVYMMDEQANIRGGTGFTYGAGSRVMLVVDDQILLAADRGDAKWNFVPMENVEQIEIIKGASSVLYGSSALNGVIAVRTAWPGLTPETNISTYHTTFDKPALADAAWWDHAPTQSGISVSHRQKFENMDLVIGGNAASHDSYLLGQYSSRARLNWKTRFHPDAHDQLTWGVNGNLMSDREGLFFLWQDADTGGFQPFQGYLDTTTTTLLNWQYKWATIDPWLNYYDKHHNSHKFKMRFYGSDVIYTDTTDGNAWLLNADYQFFREFASDVVLTAGATGYYFDVDDHDVGIHDGISAGAYVQLEKKLFDRLIINAGMREELYQVDTAEGASVPIFKGGLNYRLGASTNIRASFGQGYRFPSLVEKYARSNLGTLFIFPNPDLKPEYGWNTEIGFIQAINRDAWRSTVDVAFYLTEYFDMTEFTFNFYSGEGAGFKSLNTSRARIGGMEIIFKGDMELFGNRLTWIGGYNYIYPADISGDSSNLEFGHFMQNFIDGFTASSGDSVFLESVLKYRFRHTGRLDLDYETDKWLFGADVNYYSLMENLDAIYISFIPGIVEYREDHMHGDWIADARVGYKINKKMQVQLLGKNIFNNMYALRPAKYDPPRSFTVQWRVEL